MNWLCELQQLQKNKGGPDVIACKGIVAHGNEVIIASHVEGVACGGMAIGATIVDEC